MTDLLRQSVLTQVRDREEVVLTLDESPLDETLGRCIDDGLLELVTTRKHRAYTITEAGLAELARIEVEAHAAAEENRKRHQTEEAERRRREQFHAERQARIDAARRPVKVRVKR